jgi:hypothetical protein
MVSYPLAARKSDRIIWLTGSSSTTRIFFTDRA